MALPSAPAQAKPSEQESVHSPAHRSEPMSARESAPASEDMSGTATVRMSASLKAQTPQQRKRLAQLAPGDKLQVRLLKLDSRNRLLHVAPL